MSFNAVSNLSLAIWAALAALTMNAARADTEASGREPGAASRKAINAKQATAILDFTETRNDKIACTGSKAQGNLSCRTYSVGQFKIEAALPGDFDPQQFNETTPLYIKLGHYAFNGALGDATGYTSGSSKANFTLKGNRCRAQHLNNQRPCPTQTFEKIRLDMTPRRIILSIAALTGTDANSNTFDAPIDADSYDGSTPGAVSHTLPFQMNVGDFGVSSESLTVTGTVLARDATDKSGDSHTLSKVSLKGTLTETDLTEKLPAPSSNTVFWDDFSGSSLNPAWTVISRHGEYSQNETECNVPEQVSVADGMVTIKTEAREGSCGDFHPDGTAWHSPESWPYITGDIQWSNFNFTYGTVEIRARFPSAKTRTWPATWLLGANCQATNPWTGETGIESCPDIGSPEYTEIDMTECYNATTPWCQFHVANPGFGMGNGCDAVYPAADTAWHVYKTVWTADSIKQYRDGFLISTCNQHLGNPMFLILQTQTGGVSGTPKDAFLPATFNIDYVKVTQP